MLLSSRTRLNTDNCPIEQHLPESWRDYLTPETEKAIRVGWKLNFGGPKTGRAPLERVDEIWLLRSAGKAHDRLFRTWM